MKIHKKRSKKAKILLLLSGLMTALIAWGLSGGSALAKPYVEANCAGVVFTAPKFVFPGGVDITVNYDNQNDPSKFRVLEGDFLDATLVANPNPNVAHTVRVKFVAISKPTGSYGPYTFNIPVCAETTTTVAETTTTVAETTTIVEATTTTVEATTTTVGATTTTVPETTTTTAPVGTTTTVPAGTITTTVVVPLTDVCWNIDGDQTVVPAGMTAIYMQCGTPAKPVLPKTGFNFATWIILAVVLVFLGWVAFRINRGRNLTEDVPEV